MKIKKTKKSKGQRGKTTYGHGSRKKWRSSGEKGGKGMSGTSGHKKSKVIKLHGNKYFGKKGITSLHTKKKKLDSINLKDIQKNLNTLLKNKKSNEIKFKGYKILGDGNLKESLIIYAKEFSKSAKEKIEKLGGKAILISENKKQNKEI